VQRRREDLREMSRSQDIAAAVALKYLGYKVDLRPTGALITDVLGGSPAEQAGLEPTDVIVAVDGHAVLKSSDLRPLISRHRPGEAVRLSVRSPNGVREFRVRTVADPRRAGRPVIGVLVDQAAQVKLPFPVKIDAGSIGGPSAGLAFALDVVQELGHDITRGYRVAATGQINPDGSVSPIGGVKQKIVGARDADVDVFLVPAGDNAREAQRHAGSVKVIPVKSFRQALRALATLPRKR
jgi:PDZ domain-containing protein